MTVGMEQATTGRGPGWRIFGGIMLLTGVSFDLVDALLRACDEEPCSSDVVRGRGCPLRRRQHALPAGLAGPPLVGSFFGTDQGVTDVLSLPSQLEGQAH